MSITNFIFGLTITFLTVGSVDAQMHDNSFGTGGVSKLNVNDGGLDQLVDMTVASDGSIYVLGYTFAGSNQNIVVARYQTNGQLDATFGGFGPMMPGTVVVDIYGKDIPGAIRVLDDGKILVGCYVQDRGVTLLRLEELGHNDVTFGADHSGVVHIETPFPTV
ncbi:MAG: delta-60 repeat domain-containing protein, partial [Planctomycetota bacterium]